MRALPSLLLVVVLVTPGFSEPQRPSKEPKIVLTPGLSAADAQRIVDSATVLCFHPMRPDGTPDPKPALVLSERSHADLLRQFKAGVKFHQDHPPTACYPRHILVAHSKDKTDAMIYSVCGMVHLRGTDGTKNRPMGIVAEDARKALSKLLRDR